MNGQERSMSIRTAADEKYCIWFVGKTKNFVSQRNQCLSVQHIDFSKLIRQEVLVKLQLR